MTDLERFQKLLSDFRIGFERNGKTFVLWPDARRKVLGFIPTMHIRFSFSCEEKFEFIFIGIVGKEEPETSDLISLWRAKRL
jgi:hypothetical protein